MENPNIQFLSLLQDVVIKMFVVSVCFRIILVKTVFMLVVRFSSLSRHNSFELHINENLLLQ